MTVTSQLPPSLIATLPGRSYTDPEIFAAEQEHIFEAQWIAAGCAADLAAPGSFRTVSVGRENVLLLRGQDGTLRAFLNVCRHRGAQLCTAASAQPPPDRSNGPCSARITPGPTGWTAVSCPLPT